MSRLNPRPDKSLHGATRAVGTVFWLKRFAIAFVAFGLLLFTIELVKGHQASQAIRFAALWGAVFAMLFTVIGYVRFKRNPACMLPGDRRQ